MSTPALAGLPAEIAIFPLSGALLLPGGKLPLNIFEPRYLAMVEDSLAAGRLFGMIQPEPRPPGPADAESPLFKVGCLGRLTSFSETDDDRFLITLTGLIRFTLAEEIAGRRGYRRVRVDYTAHVADLDPATPPIGVSRAQLIAELREYFRRGGLEANWEAVQSIPDDMLVTTLCMVCPFQPAEKQLLLQSATVAERAEALLALLRMGGRDDGERMTS